MKDDAIASIEPKALTEEEIPKRNRVPQGRESDAEPTPHEYFKHIERLEVRFIIENLNKPFMPVDLREKINKDGLWKKHEDEYVKSGDVKATIAFEEGTAPADGNTEELTDILIDHMWNFVREVKRYG
jgi:hypothetical protein